MVIESPVGIFPRSDQEHLDNISTERPTGRSLILVVKIENCEGHTVSGGLCWDGSCAGLVVSGEGRGMVIFGGHHVLVGVQEPADCL